MEVESVLILDMDIGFMLLDDSFWLWGKCSYKMFFYMVCGVLVVVIDFGMNYEIFCMCEVGFGVYSL